jgi:hypothetical protein
MLAADADGTVEILGPFGSREQLTAALARRPDIHRYDIQLHAMGDEHFARLTRQRSPNETATLSGVRPRNPESSDPTERIANLERRIEAAFPYAPTVRATVDRTQSTNIAFLIAAYALCMKGIVENAYALSYLSSLIISPAYAQSSPAVAANVQTVIALMLSLSILLIMGALTYAAYFRKPPSEKAEQYLPQIVTTAFVLLSGMLGVTLR